MNEPTHLDLFSGIGGFALAARWAGFRTVAFCEIEPYAQRVLAKNFGGNVADSSRATNGKHLPRAVQRQVSESGNGDESPSIHTDIFDLDGTRYRGVTLVTGGFPCQPYSVAGKRRGAADDRAIWPEMFRVIGEARPAWILGENVPGIITMELDNVLSQLEGIGYACRTFVIPACAVDARHRRDRLWIVGRDISNTGCKRNGAHQQEPESRRSAEADGRSLCEAMADSAKFGERESADETDAIAVSGRAWAESSVRSRWLPEPDVGRVAHGIPRWLDGLDLEAIVAMIVLNAIQALRCPAEAVRILRETHASPEVRKRRIGASESVFETKVLQPFLLRVKDACDKKFASQASKEIERTALRIVRNKDQAASASFRSELQQQFASEHSDPLQALPRFLARYCETAWQKDGGSYAVDRVSRLKGLGNAIVPHVAYQILTEIRKLV